MQWWRSGIWSGRVGVGRWRGGENKVNGLLWAWATTKEGVEERGTDNAKWREDGIGKEREREESIRKTTDLYIRRKHTRSRY